MGWDNYWDMAKDAAGDLWDNSVGLILPDDPEPPDISLSPADETRLRRAYYPNPDAFNAAKNKNFSTAQQKTANRAYETRAAQFDHRAANEGAIKAPSPISGPGAAPKFGGPSPIQGQPRANISQARSNLAIGKADQTLGLDAGSRMAQQQALAMANQVAQGRGPSAAAVMANQAGAQGQAMMQDAGAQARRAFGQANTGAMGAYGDAAAQQAFMTREAGIQAANQMRQGNQAAQLAQASLASRARGGNIGAALLGAQNNAAIANQQTIEQAGQAQAAASRQAAFNAANAQRGAFNANAQANLQNAGALVRSNIQAANNAFQGSLEAARLRSGEQLAGINQAGQMTAQMRGLDQSQTGMAAQLAQLQQANEAAKLGSDQFNANLMMQKGQINADDRYRNNRLNYDATRDFAGMGLQADQFNANMGMKASLANQQNRQQNLGRFAGQEQFYTGLNAQLAGTEFGAGQDLEKFRGDMYNRGLDRWGNYLTGNANNATSMYMAQAQANSGLLGSLIGAGGAVLGALSDKRAKTDIKKKKAPNFRKAGAYSYKYKQPEKHGRGKQLGPMAQELPKEAIVKDENGLMVVDIKKLALQLASSVGELQRKVG